MKIIALIPIKNEGWILETCLSSLKGITDEIIAIDDGSDDNSVEILKKHSATIISSKDHTEISWAEHSIREKLLELGRKHGGTHFICIDGDEAFSSNFKNNAKEIFESMKPSQKLSFKWVTLWQSILKYRNDGIYKDLYKDFVFCDDGFSKYPYAFLGVQRTPGENSQSSIIKIDSKIGVVLHFQYVDFMRSQLKQAWYRCSEFLKKGKSAKRINNMYKHSLPTEKILSNTEPIWLSELPKPILGNHSDYLDKINKWFDKYGIESFEPLQIWHIPELNDKFLEKVGRKPKSKTYHPILVRLNELKNKLKKK